MVIRKYLIPLLAVAGVAVAAFSLLWENKPTARTTLAIPPSTSPYKMPVSGTGLVEASTQNIAIGTPVPGIVAGVSVEPGDEVRSGDRLFAIDNRAVQAEIEIRRKALLVAEQMLSRLQNTPRPENVSAAAAEVAEAEAEMQEANAQLAVAESAGEAMARGEATKRRYAVQASQARLRKARTQLDLVTAGAWKEDLAVAASQVELARAQLNATETELERLTVRAPIDGEVLQVNVRPGEFAAAGVPATPLMLLGGTQELHVRVDIDENDGWRICPEAKARGSLRGNSTLATDLTFVRIEPFVVPKKSLTGFASERVDTRVLQMLYSFPRGSLPVAVGQQMDVFIDAAECVKTQVHK